MYSKISAPMKSCLTLLTLASIVLKALGQNYPSSSRLSEDFVDTSRIAVRISIQCFSCMQPALSKGTKKGTLSKNNRSFKA